MELVGELVRRKRNAKGMTQEQLAAELEVARSYLSQIECLSVLPGEQTAVKMAVALGMEPDDFLDALRREKVIIKDRSAQARIELTNLDYLLSQAQRTFRYVGYSATFFVVGSFERLIHLLNKGGTLQLVLAEPTEANLCKRALEDYRVKDKSIEHIVRRMQQEFWKVANVLLYLEELRQDHQQAGSFHVLLDPDYQPNRRLMIVDDDYALIRPSREGTEDERAFSIYTRLDAEFENIEAEFLKVCGRARAIDWENWKEQYRVYDSGLITENKVKGLVSDQFSESLDKALGKAKQPQPQLGQQRNTNGTSSREAVAEQFLNQIAGLDQILTLHQVRALLLHHAGYSYAEIGDLLKVSRQAAAKHYKAAVCRLKK